MDKQAIEKEFETLIQEYRHVIWKVCYIYSKDQDHLNDLYQETLIIDISLAERAKNKGYSVQGFETVAEQLDMLFPPISLPKAAIFLIEDYGKKIPPLYKNWFQLTAHRIYG